MNGLLRRDEGGISTVLGAILVFALLAVTMVLIQVKYVPVWERDREALLMQNVGNQLALIKSDLDRQTDNRTSVPVSDPVTLDSEGGFRLFTRSHLPASLGYLPPPSGGGVRMSSPQVHLLSQGGRPTFVGSENWIDVAGGQVVQSIADVNHLRVRIPDPSAWANGDTVTLTITDGNGTYQGKLVLLNIDHGVTYTYEYQTYTGASSTVPVSVHQEDFDKQNAPAYQYVELLRSEFQFHDVLASAPTPFTLTLSRLNMEAEYTMTYLAHVPGGGSTTVGGSGTLVPNFLRTLAGGSMVFTSGNQQFPQQTHVVEHGAIITVQPDGRVMRVAPAFGATQAAGQVQVRWGVPALVGAASTVSGTDRADVALSPAGARIDFLATTPRMTFSVSTAYPDVWVRFFSETMERAGLSSASGHFTTASDATSASLTVFGLQTDPNSAVDDVLVSVRGAAIDVSIRPAG